MAFWALIVLGTSLAAASQNPSPDQAVEVSAESPQEQSHEYRISEHEMRGFMASPPASLPLTAGKTVSLNLTKFTIFRPGEDFIVEGSSKRPFLGTLYQGQASGEGSGRAFLLAAPEGFYGTVEAEGTEYSYQPKTHGFGAEVLQTVVNRPTKGMPDGAFSSDPSHSHGGRSDDRMMPPTPASNENESNLTWYGLNEHEEEDATTGITSCGTDFNLEVKPYAEQHFVNTFPDWYNRIISSYSDAALMWSCETALSITLFSVENAQRDFASISNCGENGGVKDDGLTNFKSWLRNTGRLMPEVNSYGLFHSLDGDSGNLGCGDVQALSNAVVREAAAYGHAIQGRISSTQWDPKLSSHLAKIVAHELTHNAGEPGHPDQGALECNANVMAVDVLLGGGNCVKLYRTANTIQAVKNFARPRLMPPGGISYLNGGQGPNVDQATLRGKLFDNVPAGTIKSICIWGRGGSGYSYEYELRASDAPSLPQAGAGSIPVANNGNMWICKEVSHVWSSCKLFIFRRNIVANHAYLGWDSGIPTDSRWSTDGISWTPETYRRAIAFAIVPSGATCGGSSGGGGSTVLANGGQSGYTDQAISRGKYFASGVPTGTISEICVYGRGGGGSSSVRVGLKPTPDPNGLQDLVVATIPVTSSTNAWNCAGVSSWWSASSLYIHRLATPAGDSTAYVGYDHPVSNGDSYASYNNDYSWDYEPSIKRGYKVTITY